MPTVPSTTAPARALERKRAGQQAALDHTYDRDAAIANLEAEVVSCPAGAAVSVNTFRSTLDAAAVPPKSRPGLMRVMCARGHLVLAWAPYRGIQVPVTEPSQGESANGASVRVYERPMAHPEGR